MNDFQIYEEAVAHLRRVLLHLESSRELKRFVEAHDEVLERFQPVFSKEHLPQLSQREFHSFLLHSNNQHWRGLHRQGPRITSDIPVLRDALNTLFYGDKALESRFTQAVSRVTGVGQAVATAILLIVHPEKCGVWNGTSEAGLKSLNLWPRFERGASQGERYVEINRVLNRLADELSTDLWTLDYLWWPRRLKRGDVTAKRLGAESAAPSRAQSFSLGRYLQNLLWDNWESTSLGQEWELYTEEGEPDAGYEYHCGAGRIDLFAKHKSEPRWLVIELKQTQTGDVAVGQVLRHVGWVKENLAEPGETVQGLIIAHDVGDDLRYALSTVPNVDLQRYEVQFHLHPVSKPEEEAQ